MGLKFCNEAVMCLAQLYPPYSGADQQETTPLQVCGARIIKHLSRFYTGPYILLLRCDVNLENQRNLTDDTGSRGIGREGVHKLVKSCLST